MGSIAFGVYIHIPYCLQICPYCDFTKYELGKIQPPEDYVSLLQREIRLKSPSLIADLSSPGGRGPSIETIYFGGGTPSLLEPRLILSVLESLANAGFTTNRTSGKPRTEITIEIDPATVDETKLDAYLSMGFTRFSVGAQTFNERLLKVAGRKHTAQDTVDLLKILSTRGVNYSFDLLFGLPTQTLEELRADVATALAFSPSHISAYCLTVPESHPMAKNRAPDEEQAAMFTLIEDQLAAKNILRYEISNFAKPGSESAHNLLYWTDQAYWGLGVSAHSYFPRNFLKSTAPQNGSGDWGTRFWNAPSLKGYEKEVQSLSSPRSPSADMNPEQLERLQAHQSLTDFCHTSLRLTRGLNANSLREKFGDAIANHVGNLLRSLEAKALVEATASGFKLTSEGQLLSNKVFEELTFLKSDLPSCSDAQSRN